MSLTWKPMMSADDIIARCGHVTVGMVVEQVDGSGYVWQVEIRGAGRMRGKTSTQVGGRRAVNRYWRRWLERANLQPIRDPLED